MNEHKHLVKYDESLNLRTKFTVDGCDEDQFSQPGIQTAPLLGFLPFNPPKNRRVTLFVRMVRLTRQGACKV
jgi:hypothetical protein